MTATAKLTGEVVRAGSACTPAIPWRSCSCRDTDPRTEDVVNAVKWAREEAPCAPAAAATVLTAGRRSTAAWLSTSVG